jgi:mannose-6-phosphate isomerase-like protein (cupin superfamily)
MKKIVLAALVVFTFAAVGFTEDAAKMAPVKKEGIATVNINEIKEFDAKDLLKKVPLATDKFVFNSYFLQPKQVLKLHKHPTSDELFYIVSGRGQFTVGSDQTMVDAGSVIYGPAAVPHGLVNSGQDQIIMVSVQAPKPVQMTYVENSSVVCSVCGQENIVPEGAKEGDIIICPRCHAKLKLSKAKDGKWIATQI